MITHSILVDAAAKWLLRAHAVVVTEITSSIPEQPDAIGWRGSGGSSTLIECKTSRSDFAADREKFFRRSPQLGMGRCRYFLTPANLVTVEELPERWGLLEFVDGKVRIRYAARGFPEWHTRHELAIMVSAIRRIGHTAPKGTSIRCYTMETKCRATLGIKLEPVDRSQPASGASSPAKASVDP